MGNSVEPQVEQLYKDTLPIAARDIVIESICGQEDGGSAVIVITAREESIAQLWRFAQLNKGFQILCSNNRTTLAFTWPEPGYDHINTDGNYSLGIAKILEAPSNTAFNFRGVHASVQIYAMGNWHTLAKGFYTVWRQTSVTLTPKAA